MARAFSIHGVVVAGVSEAPALHLLGEGRLKLPSPLDAVRTSSTETSMMVCHGVDAPQWVQPMKMGPLQGDRLRPPK
jgi:hypothetical protein